MARVVGLTGGLASGKSTVAAILRQLGAVVISADALAREVMEPGTEAYREVVAAFGPGVLQPDGRIDRARLASWIYADPAARRRLNEITHPRIRVLLRRELARLQRWLPADAVIVLDIPLLLDTAPRDAFPLEGVIVVAVDETTQLARLCRREGISEEEARQRLAAQRPLREKVAEADWVIDNSGTPEETRRQVEALWRRLRASPADPRGG
ncbi:MAG: dephospho-CoA kinase [Armatimonadota bacterium]|nr:dephospho-CoA kinase [Armatimonadota bacterium]MDR7426396.1 dephospho-CoA kinase [Armatimonadota bacterium]MDR7469527.1 dephospho-CoA kinase [Armatimonadota bacterium]MDR7473465.1 dephospho-CoA kinase [Armatimonadota bacterium]MDR7539361.1 dephospho-CoA kinase [Armatimonadota bacterium]